MVAKKWVKVKHKYYTTNMKPNKCIKVSLSQTLKNMEKCLIWLVLAPIPWGNDLTLANFDGWRDLNMKTILSKLWSVASRNQTISSSHSKDGGQNQNQSPPDFIGRIQLAL
jgi:hypothetical protein